MKSLLAAAVLALQLSSGPALVHHYTPQDVADYAEENFSDMFKRNEQTKDMLNELAYDPSEQRLNKTQSLVEGHIHHLNRMRAQSVATELHFQQEASKQCSYNQTELWAYAKGLHERQITSQQEKNFFSPEAWDLLAQPKTKFCFELLDIVDSARIKYFQAADDTLVCKKIKSKLATLKANGLKPKKPQKADGSCYP